MAKLIKRFLYLNQPSLESCYSQICGGLPVTAKTSSTASRSKTTQEENSLSGSIEGQVGILTSKASSSMNARSSGSTGLNIVSENENYVAMEFHDDMFNRLEKALDDNAYFKEDNNKIGDFVRIADKISIVDIGYIKSLLSNKALIKFLVDNEYDKQSLSLKTNSEKSKLKNTIKQRYDSAKETMSAFCAIVPYEKFILTGNYIVIIDDSSLRDHPDMVACKYSGEMTTLGFVTNVIKTSETQNDDNNPLLVFPRIVNSILPGMLNRKELIVVNPIGIYY